MYIKDLNPNIKPVIKVEPNIKEPIICTNFTENDFSEELLKLEQSILDSLNNNISIYYKDYEDNYVINNNDNSYYAASTSKLAVASYLYQQAELGLVDLNQVLVNTKYYMTFTYLKKSEATINNLIIHSLKYSDNLAYFLLLDYAGLNNIKEYIKTKNIDINYTDNFGYITPSNASNYMNLIHDVYNNEFYKDFINSLITSDGLEYINDGFTNIEMAHKYGELDNYYNEIIYVNSTHPYTLVLLSKSNNRNLFLDISKKIYLFNELYFQEQKTFCLK